MRSPRASPASCQGKGRVHPCVLWPQDTKCQRWAGPGLQAAASRWPEHLGLAPPPSQPLLQPCSPVVLAGGALRGALGWGALRGPLPLGAFAQPLEHGAKGRCQLRLGSAGAGGPSGVVGRRRVSSLAAQLGSGKVGQLGTGKAVSGRPLPAGEAASWGGRAAAHAPTLTHLHCSCTTSLGGKGTVQKAGRLRLPDSQGRSGLVTPTHPEGASSDYTQMGK